MFERLRNLFRPRTEAENRSGLSYADFLHLYVRDGLDQEVSARTAPRAIPVQACVALVAGGITSMPLRVVERQIVNGTMTQRPADDHDFWWLLNEQPNEDSTAALFWENILESRMLAARSYARIIRKAGGRSPQPSELVFYPNERVFPQVTWDTVRRRNVITHYLVRDGVYSFGVDASDMLDFRGRASEEDSCMSKALYSARHAVSLCLTVEEYCARFFGNGGMPRASLEYPAGVKFTEPQINALRDQWIKRYGGPANAALPLVLADGGKVSKMSFTAEEAQMLDARKFQVIEIARAFGVPPFMIGETEKTSAWGTGLEQLSQGFIRYTLGPHITAIEQELNRKLFGTSRYFVDFDEEALARGDMKSLGDWFRQAVGGSNGPGFMAPDEVRSRLRLPPMGGAAAALYVPKGVSDAKEPTAGAAGGEPDPAQAV